MDDAIITPPAYRLDDDMMGDGLRPSVWYFNAEGLPTVTVLTLGLCKLPPIACTLDEFIEHVQKHGGTVYKAVAER